MNEETRRKNLEKLMALSIKRGRIINLTDAEIRRLFGYIHMGDEKMNEETHERKMVE